MLFPKQLVVLALAGARVATPSLPVTDHTLGAAHANRHWATDWLRGFRVLDYHSPVLGMLAQGSAGSSALPACSSSTEMLSGERTKAM